MAYAPLRVFDIALVAWNDVNMDMKYTLSGRRSYVNADIVAIRIEFLVQSHALLGDQFHAGIDLVRRQVEKTGYMSTWDNQGMARTRRVGIARTVSKFMLK